MSSLVVIGGGPAGMMAAISAACEGISVTLIEKNEKLGKKLHITGKGRCNLTNNTDIQGLMANTVTNPRFLNSAFYSMDSPALITFIESLGVPLKTERGGRVFPVSDKASDINQALKSHLRACGVQVELNCTAKKVSLLKNGLSIAFDQKNIHTQSIIIATGGLSYPSTGSNGDGLLWAKDLGHTVVETYPSLVPLKTAEAWVPTLEGLSLKNVKCTVRISDKTIYEELGEMLFTSTGVTGPLILSASAFLAGKESRDATISIDLKPGLTPTQLDARLLRDFDEHKNKDYANGLDSLLPQRLIETIVFLSGIPSDKKVHSISKTERLGLVHLLKNLVIHPTGTNGYKEAVITKGGINTKEVNPSTLMSKHVPGLFFAGEILDVDALTGGYNMQIAFSTGHLAGLSAAKYLQKRGNN